MSRNTNDKPSGSSIRNDGAIPFASQIDNDSTVAGAFVSDALDTLKGSIPVRVRAAVTGLAIDTLNDEQSVALTGVATDQFMPLVAIVHMEDVGAGAAAAGDFEITIGISSGGTQILTATACTGVIGVDTKLAIDLTGAAKVAMPADSTIYVKVTTADTTAGAAHLANCYIVGETFVGS